MTEDMTIIAEEAYSAAREILEKNREYENDVNNHVIILVRNVLDTGINIIFVCILKDILQTINKHRSEAASSI